MVTFLHKDVPGSVCLFLTVKFSAAPPGIISPPRLSQHMAGWGSAPAKRHTHTQFSSVPFMLFW